MTGIPWEGTTNNEDNARKLHSLSFAPFVVKLF